MADQAQESVTVQIELPLTGDADLYESYLSMAFSKYNAAGKSNEANSLAALIEIVRTAPQDDAWTGKR